jgi:hypothetical protein
LEVDFFYGRDRPRPSNFFTGVFGRWHDRARLLTFTDDYITGVPKSKPYHFDNMALSQSSPEFNVRMLIEGIKIVPAEGNISQ